MLLDINLPDSSGLDLLREIKRRSPRAAVIMITAETLFENAVAALRGGRRFHRQADQPGGTALRARSGHQVEATGSRAGSREPSPHFNRQRFGGAHPAFAGRFDSQEVEIASAVFPEEWEYVSGDRHDLAVVDVGPALLEPLLGNLRASKEHAEIPVLVEQSRIAAAPLAGVLPKYRAMPCSHDELIARAPPPHIDRRPRAGESNLMNMDETKLYLVPGAEGRERRHA